MKNEFTLRSPARILFGSGTFEKLGEEAKTLAPKGTVLVVIDPAVQPLVGEKIEKEIFPGRRLAWQVIPPGEPVVEDVDRAAEKARAEKITLVVGIGGGSAMDTAKALSALMTNPGGVEDYRGLDRLTAPALPKIMVPTTAGTGSEVTPTAVFIGQGRKGGINSAFIIPETAILDPVLTLSVPRETTLATGLDTLAHALESYLSTNSNPYTEPLSLQAIGLVRDFLPVLAQKGDNLEARGRMLAANLLAGLTLANAGVIAGHSLSYPLGPRYGIPHGVANGILLPLVVEKIAGTITGKLARAADCLGLGAGGDEAARASRALEFFLSFPEQVGFRKRLRDLDVPREREILAAMADEALQVAVPIANTPGGMNREEIIALYEKAW